LCSLNSDLIREGLASIDPSVKYLSVYKSIVRGLEESTELAKRERLGQFEFGDVSEDP
jgi:staphylococcal nuclease domain-containing protein 1